MTARIELSTAHGIRSVDLIDSDGTYLDSWEPRGGTPSRRLALAMVAELERHELRIDELTTILRDLYDASDCSHDHHGYCQAHGWLEEGVCPMQRATDLFARSAPATT